jgi:secreted PhoX family phosphatase
MDRRTFLRNAVVASGGAVALPTVAMATGAGAQAGGGAGPYGSIDDQEPDENGLLLPAGFTSRIVAVAGESVGDTDYAWHVFPDGAATFDDGDGGWFLAVNSEVLIPTGKGGASSIHFDPDGEITDAFRILDGTTGNCAGGPTPWGTWLSCEESGDLGQVWEADPTGAEDAVAFPALGQWNHEAAAVDPDNEQVYLTQDSPEGLFYRFTPDAYPDLSAGTLEAAIVADDGAVTWGEVADPSGQEGTLTHLQVPGATVFPGNEGVWYHDGTVVFTSKGDNRVHAIDVEAQTYEVVYEGTDPLTGVDNITVENGSGDLYVAEDGGNMEVVLISAEGDVVPFARVVETGHEDSEVTGPTFNPAGDRLYFSSQRGPTDKTLVEIADVGAETKNGGRTYEITGPFRGIEVAANADTPSTATTLAAAGDSEGDDDGVNPDGLLVIGIGAVAVAAAAAGVVAVRRRRSEATADEAAAADDAGETTPDRPSDE